MLRHWLALGFAITGVAVALAGMYQWTTRPANYREAVVEALEGRQVADPDVEVHAICLPDPNCVISDPTRTFATVVVRHERASYGRITCYDRCGDCYLDLASMGIWRAPLRDLRGVRILPKPLARVTEQIVARMRATIRRVQRQYNSSQTSYLGRSSAVTGTTP
jgi:hypothetical protein